MQVELTDRQAILIRMAIRTELDQMNKATKNVLPENKDYWDNELAELNTILNLLYEV